MKPWVVGVATFVVVGLALISFTQAAGLIAIVAGVAAGIAWSRRDAPA